MEQYLIPLTNSLSVVRSCQSKELNWQPPSHKLIPPSFSPPLPPTIGLCVIRFWVMKTDVFICRRYLYNTKLLDNVFFLILPILPHDPCFLILTFNITTIYLCSSYSCQFCITYDLEKILASLVIFHLDIIIWTAVHYI